MRLYTISDEVRVTLDADLHDWARAGLLTSEQEQALRPDLVTGLRRTGPMLRLGLAAFTVIAGGGAVGLVLLTTNLNSELAVAVTATILGAGALAGATALVRRVRLYRHGVEEAMAVAAVGLFGLGAALLGAKIGAAGSGNAAWYFGWAATAIAAGVVYRRFGFQYAAVGALYATALVPMAFSLAGPEIRRLCAAVVCAAAYVYTTGRARAAADDITRADTEVVRAAAAVGAYAALNVMLLADRASLLVSPWFRWSTWVVTWLLACGVTRHGVADRDPLLLRVGLAMTLASLLTNSAYLGRSRQPWDPMVFGVLLVGVALGLRRWLSTGEGGERHGFTARPLVEREVAAIQLAGLASVAVQPTEPVRQAEPPDTSFSGGRSGGAGAGGTF